MAKLLLAFEDKLNETEKEPVRRKQEEAGKEKRTTFLLACEERMKEEQLESGGMRF